MRILFFLSLYFCSRVVVLAGPPDQYYLNQRTSEFYRHKQYDSAKAEKYQPVLKMCQAGFGYLSDMHFGYRRSVCYAGLGQTDSAIRELAPQAFYAYPDPKLWRMLDSSAFVLIADSLLSMLDEKYGKEKVRSEMKRGLDSAWYRVTTVPQTNPKLADLVIVEYSISCGFSIFGVPVVLYRGGEIVTKGLDTTIPWYLTRDYFIEEAKKSYTYQEIMEE